VARDKELGDVTEELLRLGEEENIFATYGLSRNPFPSQELPQVTDISAYVKNVCTAVREKELREIKEKFLDVAFGMGEEKGKATNLWVHGELGVGKSAIIIFIYNLLREYKSDIVVPLYIVSPGNGIDDIFNDTVRQLGGDFFTKLAQKLLAKIIARHEELIHSDEPKKIVKKIKDDPSDILAFIQKGILDADELVQKATLELSEGHIYVDDKMIKLVLETLTNYENAWDSIKNYSKKDRLDGLVTLFYLLSEASFRMTFLFIDQLEYSWRIWGKSKRDRFVMDVRELVQRSMPYLSVLCTSNVDLTEDIEVNHPTLLRPLPMNPGRVTVIKPLSKEQMRTLIEFYLDLARVSKKSPELYPFTESAIDFIYDKYNGVTGHVLAACFEILNHAARRKLEIIDEEVAKNWYLQRKKVEEEKTKEEKERETKIKEEDLLR
jgi:hypothetical protein